MSIVKHLIISGRVQGVGYRHFVDRAAHELRVTGWVRNRHDGSVEAMLSGTSEAVHTLIERARHGPPHALITGIRISEGHGSFERFETLATA